MKADLNPASNSDTNKAHNRAVDLSSEMLVLIGGQFLPDGTPVRALFPIGTPAFVRHSNHNTPDVRVEIR